MPAIFFTLGRRQAVRHRILVPASGGSNPPAPAILIYDARFHIDRLIKSVHLSALWHDTILLDSETNSACRI